MYISPIYANQKQNQYSFGNSYFTNDTIFYSSPAYLRQKLQNDPSFPRKILNLKNESGQNICHRTQPINLGILFEELNEDFYSLLSQKDYCGNTPLHLRASDLFACKTIFENPKIDKNKIYEILLIKNFEGETPLYKMNSINSNIVFSFFKDEPNLIAKLLLQKNSEGKYLFEPRKGCIGKDTSNKFKLLHDTASSVFDNPKTESSLKSELQNVYEIKKNDSNKQKKPENVYVAPYFKKDKPSLNNVETKKYSPDYIEKARLLRLKEYLELDEDGVANVFKVNPTNVYCSIKVCKNPKYKEEAKELIEKILTTKNKNGFCWAQSVKVIHLMDVFDAPPDFWYDILTRTNGTSAPVVHLLNVEELKKVEDVFKNEPELFLKLLNSKDTKGRALKDKRYRLNQDLSSYIWYAIKRANDKISEKTGKANDDFWFKPRFGFDGDFKAFHERVMNSKPPVRYTHNARTLLFLYKKYGDDASYKELLKNFKFSDDSVLLGVARATKTETVISILEPVKDDFELVSYILKAKDNRGKSFIARSPGKTVEALKVIYPDDLDKVKDFCRKERIDYF